MVSGLRAAPAPTDLTIGVVGPRESVERVMLMAEGAGGSPGRLTAAACRNDQEVSERVVKLRGSSTALLFTDPLSYEVARKSDVLTVPATYVPLTEAALYGALLRAAQEFTHDPARVSVDVLARDEVEEAFGELGIATSGVFLHEGHDTPDALVDFHRQLWRDGTITLALTCVPDVQRRLTTAGVPATVIRPGPATVRAALSTAALLGVTARLEDAQLVVGVIDVPTLRDAPRHASRYWREEMRLSLHRLLLQEAHQMNATVWPINDHSYLMASSFKSLVAATDDLRVPPFVGRVRETLGVAVDVGVGLGNTADDAETHAHTALARTKNGSMSFVTDAEGRPLTVQARDMSSRPGTYGKGLEVLSRLSYALSDGEHDRPLVLDAETAAEALHVTPRTARRLLRVLVEEGLAWPLPPSRSPQPGRPRQLYRLIVEKLQ